MKSSRALQNAISGEDIRQLIAALQISQSVFKQPIDKKKWAAPKGRPQSTLLKTSDDFFSDIALAGIRQPLNAVSLLKLRIMSFRVLLFEQF